MISRNFSKALPGLLAMVFCSALVAQSTSIAGDLVGFANNFPFNGTSFRFQTIFTAAELNKPGGAPITEVAYHGQVLAPATYNNFRLRLAHTTVAPLATTTTFANNHTSPLQDSLFAAQFTPTTEPGLNGLLWWKFPLTTQFQYDGVSNVLLDVSYDSKVGTGFRISSAAGRNRIYLSGGNSTSVTASASTNSGNHGVRFTFLDGPQLTVAATAGTSQIVVASETGPGGNGIQAGTFTISSGTMPNGILSNIHLSASGTGDDSQAYTSIAIWRDANLTGSFEAAADALVATTTTFPTNDGTINFNLPANEQLFVANEQRRYFVVVKLNGPQLAVNTQTFNYRVSDITVDTVTTKLGVPSITMNGLTIIGPALTPAPVNAGLQSVLTTETGGGDGFRAATFQVAANAAGSVNLNSISITASGSGNDATMYSEVALYEDTDNSTQFEIANDAIYGTAATAFPADNGSLVFSQLHVFSASQTRRYFIVVKLAGAVPASENHTFTYSVSAMNVDAGAGVLGTPTSVFNGLIINGPLLTVSATAGTAQQVLATATGPGGDGILAGTFTIANDNINVATLDSITLGSSGSGNDLTAYTEIALYEDSNVNDTWEFGVDPLYGAAAPGFLTDNGIRLFSQSLNFAVSQSRRFFVVVKLNGTPLAINGHTFNFAVSAVAVPAGSAFAGVPSATMNGIVIDGPVLTFGSAAGTAQSVLHTETGPSNNGLAAVSFTVSNSAASAGSLVSMALAASGTGNDATAYTHVGVYEDVNDNSTFEFGTDLPFGTTITAFGGDNGTEVFAPATPLAFAPSQARRYFVVIKLNSASPPVNNNTFNFQVTAVVVGDGTTFVAVPTAVMLGLSINGPVLAVSATAGSAQPTFAHETGTGNNGINVGTFTITNSASTGTTLGLITLVASGTGDDLNAYSNVRLVEDSNTNSAWDLTDAQVGTALTAYSANNGTAAFTPSAAQGTFAASASKRYFVIVRLNGSTLASVGHTFNCQVQSLSVGTNALTSGTPSATMLGLVISAPTFNVADVPLAPVVAYRTLGDYVLQKFTVGYPAGPNNSLSSITVGATGTGNDLTDFTAVRLFLDDPVLGTPGDFDAADSLLGTLVSFGGDNGPAQFSGLTGPAAAFSAGQNKTYFVIGDFGATPQHNSTFTCRVQAATAGYTGSTFTPALPTSYSTGVVVELPPFIMVDNSGQNLVNAFFGDTGFSLQKFTVEYPSGPDNVLATVTATATGTGNDLLDYSAVHLVLDDPLGPSPGVYDALDTVVNTQPAFSADDGVVTFNLAGPAAQFVATDLKQFFVIVDFNQNGVNATTFSSSITAAGGTSFGSPTNGLPLGPSAGLLLLDANLQVTFNGPGSATTVNSDSQGINDEGLMICDVSLATGPGSFWSIDSLTFVGTGTGNHETAYSDLWLYEDDGNGVWDGPSLDAPAASPLVSFSAGTLDATFDLLNVATGLNATRRFYLFGRLAGTATSGQTLNARLETVTGAPVVGGSVRGMPLPNSTALIIEQTALTVLSGPASPADLLRKAGTAFVHPILNVRLAASNNDVSVNGITFSNAGTGDFAASLQSGTGFQVWLDDGDGVFTASDALISQTSGASLVSAVFNPPITVANSATRDLWVVLDVLATAGNGAAVPDSYQTVINGPADVDAQGGIAVLMGTPAPQSNVLRLVDFFVSSFDPVADLPGGGKDITILGSGFMAPIVVQIDGVVCPGTAVINGGTQVTGIQVPPGTGIDRPITVKSGQLDVETLSQTFDYVPLQAPKPASNSGCAAGAGVSAWWLLSAMTPLLFRLRRRK